MRPLPKLQWHVSRLCPEKLVQWCWSPTLIYHTPVYMLWPSVPVARGLAHHHARGSTSDVNFVDLSVVQHSPFAWSSQCQVVLSQIVCSASVCAWQPLHVPMRSSNSSLKWLPHKHNIHIKSLPVSHVFGAHSGSARITIGLVCYAR